MIAARTIVFPRSCNRSRSSTVFCVVVVVVIFSCCVAAFVARSTWPSTTTTPAAWRGNPAALPSLTFGDTACGNNNNSSSSSDGPTAEAKGLEYCPQLRPLMPLLLENKRALLRLVIDAATTGAGGNSPLMLLGPLVGEITDIYFSKTTTTPRGVSKKGWVQEKAKRKSAAEPFLTRLDAFYYSNLRRTRPVVVYVTGEDVCALWDELSHTPAGGENEIRSDPILAREGHNQTAAEAVAKGSTPIALVTLGWDGHGAPFYGGTQECSEKILALPQVVRWFTSHSMRGAAPSPKVKFVAIGFGWTETRSGLQQSTYLKASTDKLRALELCEEDQTMEVLFMCNNNSSNTPRPAINRALEESSKAKEDKGDGVDGVVSTVPRIIPVNHFPMKAAKTVAASTNGIFAISPPGTRPDCFRHSEFLLAGNIVYMPDDPSLRLVYAGLPVAFVQGRSKGWGEITCEVMVQHAILVAQRLKQGLKRGERPFQYEKLMLPYWTRFVRDEVWAAEAEIRQTGIDTVLAEEYIGPQEAYPEMTVGKPHL